MDMHIKLLWALVTICLLLAATGCDKAAGDGVRTYPYRIVTTVGMVGDIVRNVAGDKATVEGLLGEGVDPHLYKPTRDDVAALMRADAVFYSGLMLEGKMAEALASLARDGKPVYAVTERIDEQYLLRPADAAGHHDPHVWMDPSAWSKAVDSVAAALAELDRPNADYYKANATAYSKQLAELDSYARRVTSSIPKPQRVLVTAHDAFSYFGRAYDFEVLGIQGLSTESEAGLQDLRRLIDLIVARNVKAVFVESSVSEKNVSALVEGARSRRHAITIGGELYSDAMGPTGTYEGTYIGMIDHNVTTITRALGGEAPEKGMQGKLSHGPK